MAVGRATARAVPKAIRVAIVGSISRSGENPELDRDHDEAASDPQHPGGEACGDSGDHQAEGEYPAPPFDG